MEKTFILFALLEFIASMRKDSNNWNTIEDLIDSQGDNVGRSR